MDLMSIGIPIALYFLISKIIDITQESTRHERSLELEETKQDFLKKQKQEERAFREKKLRSARKQKLEAQAKSRKETKEAVEKKEEARLYQTMLSLLQSAGLFGGGEAEATLPSSQHLLGAKAPGGGGQASSLTETVSPDFLARQINELQNQPGTVGEILRRNGMDPSSLFDIDAGVDSEMEAVETDNAWTV